MKKTVYPALLFFFSFFGMESKAQLPDGSTAPDFTFTDMNGNAQHLYAYLNAGKPVVIDISATWCHPCWNYHNSGSLESFYQKNGPPGTNKAMVVFIESDWTTSDSDMQGTGNFTEGDWVTGTPYPMCNPPDPEINNFLNDYKNLYVPCIYLICTDKKTRNLGQPTAAELDSALAACGGMTATSDIAVNPGISVFPNPSAGNVFVNLHGLGTGNASVKVYNVMGEVILQEESIASDLKFDLADQQDGIYFVEVRSGQTRVTKKIILNK